MKIINWIDPKDCDPPHEVTHPEFLIELIKSFQKEKGWKVGEDCLIGYYLDGRLQLISGSHRHAAALIANIKIPVMIYTYEEIQSVYGSDRWKDRIKKIPIVSKQEETLTERLLRLDKEKPEAIVSTVEELMKYLENENEN